MGEDGWGVNPLVTVEDHSSRFPVTPIGNAWSRRFYDGPFHVFDAPPDRPAISLVFVQSKDGNTAADNPADLGGGPTDKHLIYEGLSRVAADAVLAGAGSVGHHVFFTIGHPELVALRLALGLPRHPTQMVISKEGRLDLSSRLFSHPDVPVLLLAGDQCRRVIGPELRDRPWVTMVPIADSQIRQGSHLRQGCGGQDGGQALAEAFAQVRSEHRIRRISAIGGRTTATQLVDAGVVQDIYLTTSAIEAGEPDTPWYVGERRPRLDTIVQKREVTTRSPLLFEHLAIR